MRTAIYTLAVLLILSSIVGSAAGQVVHPINVGLAAALPLPIGKTVTVTVTVTNIVNTTVQLTFLGLRWKWMRPTSFFIGSNSDKGAVLAAGDQIKYPILVNVPSNVTEGTYTLTTYVSYRWFKGGNWTGVIGAVWVSNMPVAFPAGQVSATTETGLIGTFINSQTSGLATVAVLVAIVAIGLFLERRHISNLVGRFRKASYERAGFEQPAKFEREKSGQEKKKRKAEEEKARVEADL